MTTDLHGGLVWLRGVPVHDKRDADVTLAGIFLCSLLLLCITYWYNLARSTGKNVRRLPFRDSFQE